MEWSIGNSSSRYKVNFSEKEELLSLSKLIYEDKEINFDKNIVKQICNKLYDDKILSIIVEGGTKTLSNFIDSDLWDEMRIFKTQEILGDGVKGPAIKFKSNRKVEIENNILEYYLNNGVTFSNI